MPQRKIQLKKRKKDRIKINNLNDFKDALIREGYKINELNEDKFKEIITKTFEVDNSVTERLHICIKDTEITYIANDIRDFMDYIEKIMLFENEHNKLCKKIIL